MTILKTSTSYFACASPATTAATLSSIWFQPSIDAIFALSIGSFPMWVSLVWPFPEILKSGHVVRTVYGLMFYS